MGNKRKIFFNSLLSSAIILSILSITKITVVLNIPIACSFFIFPITYLCISIVNELGGYKEAISSLLSAVGVTIISYLFITLMLNLPNQLSTINEANAIQLLYGGSTYLSYYIPNIRLILGSTLGLLISGLILIVLYSTVSKYTYKTISCFLSNLISLLIYNAIFVGITQLGIIDNHDFIMMMLNRFIFSVAWTVIISILFSVFSYHKKKVDVMSIDDNILSKEDNKNDSQVNSKNILKKDKNKSAENKNKVVERKKINTKKLDKK